MTQPQYGYPPQQAPQYPPAPGYPPAQPAYQQPAAPAYPPQPQYGYPPAPAPGYGYPPQAAPQAPPAQPLAQGSLDDFYNQPSSGGGQGLKFTGPSNQPLIGQSYLFRVARPLGRGDVQQQTDKDKRPLFWRDGSPKYVMTVPAALMEPHPDFPDGQAKWYCKGMARDELSRAMAEAGAPEGPPEHNAVIRVTLVGTRPSGPGMNASHQFAIQYWRPENAVQAGGDPMAAQAIREIDHQLQQAQAAPTANYQPAPANYAPPVQAQQLPAPAPYQIPGGQAAMQQAVNQFPQDQGAQTYAQPAPVQGAQQYSPQGPSPVQQAAPNYAPQAPAPQAVVAPQSAPAPQQPVQQQLPIPGQLPAPENMSAQQQELLQRMRAQQAPAAPQQQ